MTEYWVKARVLIISPLRIATMRAVCIPVAAGDTHPGSGR